MIDHVERLRTLARLRRRDVERRTHELADAARALAAAEAERGRARSAVDREALRNEEALSRRLAAPGDELTAVFCRTTEAALAEASARLAAAQRTLEEAQAETAERRRRLLHAQARCQSLETILAKAAARQRRLADRRLVDEPASAWLPAAAGAFA